MGFYWLFLLSMQGFLHRQYSGYHLTNSFPYLLATSYHEAIYGFHESVQHTFTVFQATNTKAIANLLAPTNTLRNTLINIPTWYC